MARKVSPLQALEDEMVAAVVAATGLQPAFVRCVVRPISQHLASEYGGSRIYIPKTSAATEDDIRAAFYKDNDVEGTCQLFGISRRTLYRILGKAA